MTTTPAPQCTGGAAIDHPETGVCNHAASEPAVPAVGDKYTCTTETGTRTVTVTRVGQNIDGPAVEFEWRDPQSPLYGAGLTLPVFLGTYKPAVAPEPTVTVTVAQLEAALRPWLELLHVDLHYSLAEPEDGSPDQYPAETALLFGRLRKAAGGEQA